MKPQHVAMALGGLGWTIRDLAAKARVSPTTLVRFSAGNRTRPRTLEDIRRVLAEAGAEFIEDGERVGVTVRARTPSE